MPGKRKARVTTGYAVKKNIGNYESFEIRKAVEVEIEFASADELKLKSAALDDQVRNLLDAAVAKALPSEDK
ncbi:MAG TPA: hypothetical protein VGP72_26965 [Planctomycetota bacterium]|jgi:ribosomal protein S16